MNKIGTWEPRIRFHYSLPEADLDGILKGLDYVQHSPLSWLNPSCENHRLFFSICDDSIRYTLINKTLVETMLPMVFKDKGILDESVITSTYMKKREVYSEAEFREILKSIFRIDLSCSSMHNVLPLWSPPKL